MTHIMHYLMLVRSALQDLCLEGSGLVMQYSTRLHLMLYQPLDHNPSPINHVKHELTNIKMVNCCSVADIKLRADFRQCLLTASADIVW